MDRYSIREKTSHVNLNNVVVSSTTKLVEIVNKDVRFSHSCELKGKHFISILWDFITLVLSKILNSEALCQINSELIYHDCEVKIEKNINFVSNLISRTTEVMRVVISDKSVKISFCGILIDKQQVFIEVKNFLILIFFILNVIRSRKDRSY